MGCTSDQYLAGKIDEIKALIAAAMAAELQLASGGIPSYTIDTGQDRQGVVKFNLTEMRNYIDSLFNRLVTLETRLYGCGVVTTRPCW